MMTRRPLPSVRFLSNKLRTFIEAANQPGKP